MTATAAATVDILGVGVSAINLDLAARILLGSVRERRSGYVCVTSVHGVVEAQSNPSLRSILNGAFLCTPDGMPLVWLGRAAGHRQMGRVYGPDLLLRLCADTAGGDMAHFFYGGGPGVAGELAERLCRRFPGMRVAGVHAPPFHPLTEGERAVVVEEINASGADIVWVGLSTPKQERWMAEFRSELVSPLLIGVGAAFDIHAGRVRQAPLWMQRSGVEWLFRLAQEPGRLLPRYGIIVPRFLWLIARARFASRRARGGRPR